MEFNDINVGEEFRIYSALLCLIALIYLFFKKPAGVFFIGSIVNSGMGSTSIFYFNFAVIVVLIQLITIFKLYISAFNLSNSKRINFSFPNISKLYILLLFILITKVFLHVYVISSHNDLFIFLEIGKTFLFTILFPITIFYLSVKNYGIKKVSTDIILGTFLLSISILGPFIVPLISTGYLFDGLSGAVTIKMYSSDTINGSRIFYLLALISILAIYLKLDLNLKKVIIVGIFVFASLLLLLSGTRQFVIPLVTIILFYGNFIKKISYRIIGVSILLIGFSYLNFSENESLGKLSRSALTNEVKYSRGQIWATGFTQMINQNPLTGLGYSNFGGGFIYYQSSAGNKSYVLEMYPHGFLQSVFIEQGIILGVIFLSIIVTIYFSDKKHFSNYHKALFILIVCFNWSESFSGDLENSLSFYMLPFVFVKSKYD